MQLQRACKCHVQLRSQIPFFIFQKISYIVYCISRISLYKSMYMQMSIHFLETNSAVLILSKIFIMHSALHTIAQGYIIYYIFSHYSIYACIYSCDGLLGSQICCCSSLHVCLLYSFLDSFCLSLAFYIINCVPIP